jgi:hypothetical protein
MIMGKQDKVSERRALEEKKNIFILKEWTGDVWEDKMKFATCSLFTSLSFPLQQLKCLTRTPDEVSCALRAGREKGQFDTLGDSGRVAGGRVETL